MDSPYAHQYGWLLPESKLKQRLTKTSDASAQKQIVTEYLAAGEHRSPYEFYGLMWNYPVDDYPGDLQQWILDFIVENKRRWDPDEVACFLLEVAEDHVHFAGDTYWLKAINMSDMMDWPNANNMLWEMYHSDYDEFLQELVEHYHWDNVFANTQD